MLSRTRPILRADPVVFLPRRRRRRRHMSQNVQSMPLPPAAARPTLLVVTWVATCSAALQPCTLLQQTCYGMLHALLRCKNGVLCSNMCSNLSPHGPSRWCRGAQSAITAAAYVAPCCNMLYCVATCYAGWRNMLCRATRSANRRAQRAHEPIVNAATACAAGGGAHCRRGRRGLRCWHTHKRDANTHAGSIIAQRPRGMRGQHSPHVCTGTGARPCHICTGTGACPCHICTGTAARPCHVCTGTGFGQT
jgi:hypothetical protein